MASSSSFCAEEVSQNPFLCVLRRSFDKLYQSMLDKQQTLLVPSAAACAHLKITQVLIESHIVQTTHIPGNFLNLMGQGVEFRDGWVHTTFGFAEDRACRILQEENMYDSGSAFKVICIDRPLQGPVPSSATQPDTNGKSPPVGALLCEKSPTPAAFLTLDEATVMTTMTEWGSEGSGEALSRINGLLNQFKQTYVLISGLEHEAAERIRQLTDRSLHHLAMHRPELLHGAHRRYLQEVAERYVYASLFSVLWNHLVSSLKSREMLVQRAMSVLSGNQQSLLADLQVPASLHDIDLRSPSAALLQLRSLHTPHEKLEYLENVCELIYKAVEEHSKRAGSPTQATWKKTAPVGKGQ
eukprot:GHVS01027890.1.p1 GENE.GHVS01027890.1~~GHVS01027890.1.p1  ORF type:complete len:355 (+),score=49.41 GHVS01027890.1:92-1156(+)